MLFEFLLLPVLVVLVFYWFVKRENYWDKRGVVNTSANGMFRGKSMIEVFDEVYKKYEGHRYVGIFQLSEPILLIRDPELIKTITVRDFDHFTDHRTIIKDNVELLWSRNLLALKGTQWKEMRTTLSPTFTGSKMRTMHPLVVKCAQKYTEHLIADGVKNYDIKDLLTRFGNDVIATTAFGIEIDSWIDKNNEFYLMGKEATNMNGFMKVVSVMFLMKLPKIGRMLGMRLFSQRSTNFFMKLVDENVKSREANGITRPDMINIFLEYKKEHPNDPMSLEEMTAQAMVFFLAGFDSFSTTMTFLLYELAVNPNVQSKLYQEIVNVLKESKGELTFEAIVNMKYMDAVIMESLRKWPPGSLLDRQCVKKYIIQPTSPREKPVVVDEGIIVVFPLVSIQKDSRFWKNPDAFNPERFKDGLQECSNNCLHLSFGNGPRHCIGKRFAMMEMKTILACFLQTVEFKVCSETAIPLKLSSMTLTLAAERPIMLEVKPRNK